MRRMALIAASLVATTLQAASAQSCTTPQGNASSTRTCDVIVSAGTMSVDKLGTMTISSTSTVALTTPTTTDYDNALKAEPSTNSRTVTISANAPWDLRVTPATVTNPSYWTPTNDGSYGSFVAAETDKPSTDLLIGTTYSSTGAGYTALSANNSTSIALLAAQAPANARIVNIYWATVWQYQFDTPGTYVLPFTLSLNLN